MHVHDLRPDGALHLCGLGLMPVQRLSAWCIVWHRQKRHRQKRRRQVLCGSHCIAVLMLWFRGKSIASRLVTVTMPPLIRYFHTKLLKGSSEETDSPAVKMVRLRLACRTGLSVEVGRIQQARYQQAFHILLIELRKDGFPASIVHCTTK